MTFKIITADERLQQKTGVKLLIVGAPGIGKTSLLKTLEQNTLCLDLEAGLLAVQDWKGCSISIRTWPLARDIACLIGGPNPALRPDQPYSLRHYEALKGLKSGHDVDLSSFQVIFIDSLTIASRLCLGWCRQQPEAFSERTGKADPRAAYGLLAQEMTSWLNQFQYIPDKDVIFTGLLDQKTDEFQKTIWQLQCEGNKTVLEIPGILDEVLSMVPDTQPLSGKGQRMFVCQTINT